MLIVYVFLLHYIYQFVNYGYMLFLVLVWDPLVIKSDFIFGDNVLWVSSYHMKVSFLLGIFMKNLCLHYD